MKVISLNVWGGRVKQPLTDFLKSHEDTDIFCFQEVYNKAEGKDTIWLDGTNFSFLDQLKQTLTNHDSYYHPHLGDWWGLAMFIKKGTAVARVDEHFVYTPAVRNLEIEMHGNTAKNIEYAHLATPHGPRTVVNFHGMWNGGGKEDCAERISQSENIAAFLTQLSNPYIILGDFNLLPDTKSIQILEAAGMRNLIKETGVTSTRTSFYKKENRFADYTFVSDGVTVHDFRVLPDEVSDHSPLYLDFE